jgi:hypothetical protein
MLGDRCPVAGTSPCRRRPMGAVRARRLTVVPKDNVFWGHAVADLGVPEE